MANNDGYKEMRFGCLATIAIIIIAIAINTCNKEKHYKNRDNDYDPSSVTDNPSRK